MITVASKDEAVNVDEIDFRETIFDDTLKIYRNVEDNIRKLMGKILFRDLNAALGAFIKKCVLYFEKYIFV